MKRHLLKSFGVQNAMDESQIKSILSEKMEGFDLAGYRYVENDYVALVTNPVEIVNSRLQGYLDTPVCQFVGCVSIIPGKGIAFVIANNYNLLSPGVLVIALANGVDKEEFRRAVLAPENKAYMYWQGSSVLKSGFHITMVNSGETVQGVLDKNPIVSASELLSPYKLKKYELAPETELLFCGETSPGKYGIGSTIKSVKFYGVELRNSAVIQVESSEREQVNAYYVEEFPINALISAENELVSRNGISKTRRELTEVALFLQNEKRIIEILQDSSRFERLLTVDAQNYALNALIVRNEHSELEKKLDTLRKDFSTPIEDVMDTAIRFHAKGQVFESIRHEIYTISD